MRDGGRAPMDMVGHSRSTIDLRLPHVALADDVCRDALSQCAVCLRPQQGKLPLGGCIVPEVRPNTILVSCATSGQSQLFPPCPRYTTAHRAFWTEIQGNLDGTTKSCHARSIILRPSNRWMEGSLKIVVRRRKT